MCAHIRRIIQLGYAPEKAYYTFAVYTEGITYTEWLAAWASIARTC